MKIKYILPLFALTLLLGAARREQVATDHPKATTANPLLAAPDELFDFSRLDVAKMREAATQTESAIQSMLAAIVAVDDDKRRFDNTMQVLDDLKNKIYIFIGLGELITSAHPDEGVRNVAGEMQKQFTTISDDLLLNESLYKAISAYAKTPEALSLTGERKFFLNKWVADFKRNGMTLAKSDRDTLQAINQQLNELSVEFGHHISNDKTVVILEEADMAGLPEGFKKPFYNKDGKYYVVMSTPVYSQFMAYAKNPGARKKMYTAKMNIGGAENERLLVTILALRKRKANLLGFETYAEFITADIMSKNTKNVWNFEKKLATDLRPKAQADLAAMLAVKSKETGKRETTIYPHDNAYYAARLMEKKYRVDPEKVKEYFEIQQVIGGVFTVYQKLYNLNFVRDTAPSVWHKDVLAYSVWDNESQKRIGYFYLDLYPRENKYNHFACFPITGSKKLLGGSEQLRSAALVCNFPAPTAEKPSLLAHKQAETFFHEFGHLIHVLLSETELASLAGTNVPTDFVEAPSQIMENWCWQKNVLRLFAKHYKTGEVIPDTLVDRMILARNMNSGMNMLQQVFYGTLDFTLNDGMEVKSQQDITTKVRELQNSITLCPYVEETHFAGSFGHLTGYGSQYYGYLWSLVYAQDMFSVFEKEGVLSPVVGKRYRTQVLSKGGSNEALNLVRNFIGREPNNKAFLKQQGLK
jgi:thimet oligopeptidase